MIRLLSLIAVVSLFAGCGSSHYVRPSYNNTMPGGPAMPKAPSKKSAPAKNNEVKPRDEVPQVSHNAMSTHRIKQTAQPYLGVRYKFGGTTKRGFDCSGFVWRMFQDMGYTDFSRISSSVMYKGGKKVRRSAVVPGDLCFFNTSGKGVSHVGIMVDSETFVHASSSKGITYTKLSNSYWRGKIVGFRRYY